MNEKLEKAKRHIKRHKASYSFIGGFSLATFTCIIMRGRYAENPMGLDEDLLLKQVVVRPLSFLSKQTTNVVTVVEREGRGHPGYIVRCIETDDIFMSQKQAAKALMIPASTITDHLNGKFENASGYHFERIGAL